MAETTYQNGFYIVRKYDNLSTDFPAGGVAISDVAMVIVKDADADVTIQVTLDKKSDIRDGVAEWVDYETIESASGGGIVIFDPAPNGININTTATTGTIWVKS